MNKLYRIFTTFLLFLLGFWNATVCHSQTVFSGLPFINNYTSDNYKGGIQNWQITQDRRGLMYVANNFGVLEFDGTEWYVYPVKNGTKVRSISIDEDGQIFTGSQGDFGYLKVNGIGQYEYVSLVDKLPQDQRNIDETWRVFSEEDKVYFCTFSKIYIYENEKIKTIETNLYLEPSFYINKQLYIQSPGNPLMTLDKVDKLQKLPGGDFFKDKLITAIIHYNKNEILIATKHSGIYIYDGISIKPWFDVQYHLSNVSLIINTALRLRDGNIVIGTQSHGLYIFNSYGQMILHLDMENGLASNTVLSLFQDKDENLWVGLNNGISHIELASPFTVLNHDMGVQGTGYTGYADQDRLYLGTNIGLFSTSLVNLIGQQDATFSFSKVRNSDGQVYNLKKIRNNLFMGHHNGAYLIENNEAVRLSQTGAWTFLQNPESSNKIIMGTYSGISRLEYLVGQWKDKSRWDGFYESSRVMAIDDDDDLWMTHGYKGAYKLKVDYQKDSIINVKFYNSNYGFPSDILINVFKVRNEIIFTAERGIYLYDKENDNFALHPEYTALLGENIHIRDMDEDPMGNIYFITNDQCGVIRENGAHKLVVDFNSFNKIPKLLNDDLVNVTAIDLNNIIYGGKQGFIHFDTRKNPSRNDTYSMLIRKVHNTTHGDSIIFDGNMLFKTYESGESEKKIEMPYNLNDLRFTYSAAYYEGIEDIRYQYYLANFDDEWSAWNYKTEKEYTNLREGEYIFNVKALNIYGQQSEVAAFEFTIGPPWYRTYFAYSFYGIAGLFVILVSMLVVDRKHKKDKLILQERQEKELSSKEIQLKTIEEQKEAEIALLKNEKLSAELNHKNTELASVTMHLLTKNELIGEIKNKLLNTKDQEDTQQIKRNLNKVLKEIEASTDLDKDWQQFEFHFDRVHRDFNKRIKEEFPQLTPQEMKLCAYLRLNFTTKEIAQLLHISVRGVEISRYRLRKKLKLARNINLTDFILNY